MRNIAIILLITISLSCASQRGVFAEEPFLPNAIDRFVMERLQQAAQKQDEQQLPFDELVLAQLAADLVPQPAPAAPNSTPILHLTNGDFAAGLLKDSGDSSSLVWQCGPFTKPFQFNLNSVAAVHFPQPAKPVKPTGEFGFELAGGDVLYGSLLALSDKEVVIDSPTFGQLRLHRDFVRRLLRWGDAAGFVYVGPSGLASWKEPPAPAASTAPAPQAQIEGANPFNAPAGVAGVLRLNVAAVPAAAPAVPQPAQPIAPTQPQWRQESGHLLTDRAGASIYNDVGLPAKAIVEVELSWKNKPDFVLSLADSDQPNQPNKAVDDFLKRAANQPAVAVPMPAVSTSPQDHVGSAFRIEVLGANVILMRDLGDSADLVSLENLSPGAGRIHWHVYLDQQQGRAVVYSAEGKQLNELVLPDSAAKTATGIRLINKHGDIRLERLRVSRWNGELPKQIEADKSRVHRADGTLVYGEAKGYDPQRKQLIVSHQAEATAKATETRLDVAQITSIVLSNREASPAANISASLQNGVRLSGNLAGVEGGKVKIESAGIVGQIAIPIAHLQSLLAINKPSSASETTWQSGDGTVRKVTKAEADAPAQPGTGRVGRLDIDGLRLHGELADGEAAGDATSLVWKPIGSKNGSPLRQNISGRIVYRDLQPKVVTHPENPQAAAIAQQQAAILALQARNVRARRVIINGQVVNMPNQEEGVPVQPPVSANPSLHLRVGDTIPCEVKKIDEKGVTFYSPVTDATFVANEKVKAVELAQEQQSKNIGKTKRDRLLTTPRMQKNNPPTHLVIAKNGDFLRGRLSEMNDKSLALEVRMENRELPRDKVSRIIWFHPETKEAEQKEPTVPLGAGLVQTMRRDGARLTFVPDRCDDGILSGKSEVLGQCRVDVSLVDQILFGKAIDDAQVQLAYHPWKLQDAAEPKYVQEEAAEGNGSASAGTESALVGKPAPDFALPLVGGGALKLSDHRGKVVVLDFFATWCGPCVQAMPNIDRTVEEFKDQGVKLIAVNMQEDAKKVNDLLERLDIKPTVAMDRDGAAAEKYGVTAIPQTVVIDPQGKVARVFIGGGPKLPEQLAEAIRTVLKPAANAN